MWGEGGVEQHEEEGQGVLLRYSALSTVLRAPRHLPSDSYIPAGPAGAPTQLKVQCSFAASPHHLFPAPHTPAGPAGAPPSFRCGASSLPVPSIRSANHQRPAPPHTHLQVPRVPLPA